MADVRARKPAKKAKAKVAKADNAAPADDEGIPDTRPWFLWATPVLCFALIAYLALNTQTRISASDYAGLWSKAAVPAAPWAEPIEVRDLPGRGKGLVATRDIARGELITREPALVHDIPLETAEDPAAMIAAAVNALNASAQAAYYALSYTGLSPIGLKPHVFAARLPLAIFETNAVRAGARGLGVFPRMARMNHACLAAANAAYSWREDERVLVTHALRPIARGDEVLTSYFTTRRPRAERQAYLSEQYHFDCACAVCALPPAAAAESDARVARMSSLWGVLARWGPGEVSGTDAAEAARRVWAAADAEGYLSERGQLAADAATVAAAASDRQAAAAWAARAAQWFAYELGADSVQVRQARAIAKDPRAHPAWGTRAPAAVGGPA